MNINIVTTLKRFPRIIRAWNWYKINHYSSLTLLVAVLTIILTNKSEEFEKTEISIIKRRSGETILTVDGVQEIEFDSMIDSMGFLVYEDDYEDCGKLKQVRGSKSTMLLDNWKFSCDPLQRLRLAKRAGYSGIIGYNIPTGYKTPPGVSVSLTLIGESDANILKKYSYPNSVRFYVSSKPVTYVRGRYWFVPDCSVQQLLIYVFITFFTVRFLLVPNEYNILDLYYFYMYPRLKYSELGVNIPIPLSKKLLYYFSSTKYGAYPEPIAYTHIENERVKAIQEINNNNDDFSDFGIGDKDFELVSDISVGTYGNVTKKKFLPTGEQVAVKSILKIYNGSILESEVLQCGNISDAIVRLLYAYESDIYIHFVTDLMQGSLLDFTKLLRKDHAKIFAVELGLGLEALHSFGVAHRDLKPANVFLDQKFHIKIGDFGCSAKLRQGKVRRELHQLGTKGYWAPENYCNDWTLNSDWWAYGCIVFEMFTKGRLFLTNEILLDLETKNVSKRSLWLRIMANMGDEDVKKLLKNVLNKSKFRTPFTNGMQFSERTEYLGVPIPVDRSKNILTHIPLLKINRVNNDPGRNDDAALQFFQRQMFARIFINNTDLRIDQDFRFDHKSKSCYQTNSLIGQLF